MGDVEAGLRIAASTASAAARRREELHRMRQRPLLGGRCAEQRRHDDRRAAQMRDGMLGEARRQIGLARTARRQTCVPATTDIDQGKHQPLQWNIGNVHR